MALKERNHPSSTCRDLDSVLIVDILIGFDGAKDSLYRGGGYSGPRNPAVCRHAP